MGQASAGTGDVSSEFLSSSQCGSHHYMPQDPSHRHRLLYSFGEEPPEENRVHLGHAIMSFYAALIDLLGRCAPEMHVSSGRSRGLGKVQV